VPVNGSELQTPGTRWLGEQLQIAVLALGLTSRQKKHEKCLKCCTSMFDKNILDNLNPRYNIVI
jgi:hypothetical protein